MSFIHNGAPELCPYCKGKGEILVAKAKHDAVPIHSSIKNGKARKIYSCHICNGAGCFYQNNGWTPGINPLPTIGGGDTITWPNNHKWHNDIKYTLDADFDECQVFKPDDIEFNYTSNTRKLVKTTLGEVS